MTILLIIGLLVMFFALFRTSLTAVGGGIGGLFVLPLVYFIALGLTTDIGIEVLRWGTIAVVVWLIWFIVFSR